MSSIGHFFAMSKTKQNGIIKPSKINFAVHTTKPTHRSSSRRNDSYRLWPVASQSRETDTTQITRQDEPYSTIAICPDIQNQSPRDDQSPEEASFNLADILVRGDDKSWTHKERRNMD